MTTATKNANFSQLNLSRTWPFYASQGYEAAVVLCRPEHDDELRRKRVPRYESSDVLAVIGEGFRWQIVHQRDTAAEGIIVPVLNEFTRYTVVNSRPPPPGSMSYVFLECRELPSVRT